MACFNATGSSGAWPDQTTSQPASMAAAITAGRLLSRTYPTGGSSSGSTTSSPVARTATRGFG
jgi:hypothetical protein